MEQECARNEKLVAEEKWEQSDSSVTVAEGQYRRRSVAAEV